MANWYVATTGNDTTGTGSQGNPYATVNKAISVASAGDTIYLLAGTYNQRIYINGFTATAFANLTIRNQPEATVIVQGDGTNDQVVLFNNSTWVIVLGLTIKWNHSIAPPDWKMSWVRFVNSTDCKVQSCTLPRSWVTTGGATRTLAQEYAAERMPGVQFAAGATRCGVDSCTITGVNKGVQYNGISQDCYVINSSIYDTVQSNIDIALLLTGSTSRAGVLIENNFLGRSYIEDNIQSHNSSVPTALTERGITIRGNVCQEGHENAIDLKNAGQVLVEDNDITGNWGSNNGSLDTLNRNSLFVAGAGGSDPPATHIIWRNNRVWDGSGAVAPLDHWYLYNNVFLANNRDYTGHESTYNDANAAFPAFLALMMVDSGINIGFKNNIVAQHNSIGLMFRTATDNYDGDYNCFIGNEAIAAVWANNAWPTYSLSQIRTWIDSQGWTGGSEDNSFELATLASARFVNVPSRPTYDEVDLDWSYQNDSPLIDVGGHLTTAVGAGVASTALTVVNARWFYDGFGRSDQAKDTIYIEGVGARVISSINYTTQVITLTSAATWSNDAKIWLGEDNAVNIGLDNLTASEPNPPITGGNSPAGVGREPAQLTSGSQDFEVVGLESVSLEAGPLAMVIVTGATSESGTSSAPAMLSFGVGNLTAQRSVQCLSKNGVNPPAEVRRSSDTAIAQIQNTSNGTIATALTLTGFQNTHITGTWSVAPAAAYYVHTILLNAFNSYVTDVALAALNNTVSFNPGFVADAVIVFGNSKGVPNTTGNADFLFSCGIAVNQEDVITQASFAIRSTNGSPSTVRSRLSDQYVWQHLNATGSILSGAIVSQLGSTVSITTDLAYPGSPNDLVVAAIKLNIPMSIAVWPGSTTAGTATYNLAGTNTGPGLLFLLGSLLEEANVTTAGNNRGGGYSFGMGHPSAAMVTGFHIKNDSATSAGGSYSQNGVILKTRQHDGTDAVSATLSQFTTTGFDMSWTNASGWSDGDFIVWSTGGMGHTVVVDPPMPVGTVTTLGSVVKGAFSKTVTGMPITTATNPVQVTTGGYSAQPAASESSNVTNGYGQRGAYSFTCTPMPIDTATNGNVVIASIPPGARVLHLRRRRSVYKLPLRTVMSSSVREVIESPVEQGEDEVIPYVIDTTNWGGSPTLLNVAVKRRQRNGTWVDVTASTTSGDGVVSGDFVATPNILNLIAKNTYRVEVLVGIDDRQEECYIVIRATE